MSKYDDTIKVCGNEGVQENYADKKRDKKSEKLDTYRRKLK